MMAIGYGERKPLPYEFGKEKTMYGIFVNENGCVPYADLIVGGYKRIETRKKNMLKPLVMKRVAVVRTRRNRKPMVVGYATIKNAYFAPQYVLITDAARNLTCIPEGSEHDSYVKGKVYTGKWCYDLENAERCDPYPLPADAVRHGRSWCEF